MIGVKRSPILGVLPTVVIHGIALGRVTARSRSSAVRRIQARPQICATDHGAKGHDPNQRDVDLQQSKRGLSNHQEQQEVVEEVGAGGFAYGSARGASPAMPGRGAARAPRRSQP